MEKQTDMKDDFIRSRSIENLLLMAVLGERSVRDQARTELQRRQVLKTSDDFEDSFMTNLSVV